MSDLKKGDRVVVIECSDKPKLVGKQGVIVVDNHVIKELVGVQFDESEWSLHSCGGAGKPNSCWDIAMSQLGKLTLDDCTPDDWTKASRKAREVIRKKSEELSKNLNSGSDPWEKGEVIYSTIEPDSIETDIVEKPKHYMVIPEKDVEVRHIMIALLQKMEQSEYNFSGIEMSDYVQMMQYLLRCMDKENYFQDLRKAKWYLNKLLEKEI